MVVRTATHCNTLQHTYMLYARESEHTCALVMNIHGLCVGERQCGRETRWERDKVGERQGGGETMCVRGSVCAWKCVCWRERQRDTKGKKEHICVKKCELHTQIIKNVSYLHKYWKKNICAKKCELYTQILLHIETRVNDSCEWLMWVWMAHVSWRCLSHVDVPDSHR